MQAVGRNQKVVGTDDPPLFFQTGPEPSVVVSGRGGKVHNLDRGQELFQRLPVLGGMRRLLAPEQQFEGFIRRRAAALLGLIEDATGKVVSGRDSEETAKAFFGGALV